MPDAMIGGSEFGETNTRVLSREAAGSAKRRMAFHVDERVEAPAATLYQTSAQNRAI